MWAAPSHKTWEKQHAGQTWGAGDLRQLRKGVAQDRLFRLPRQVVDWELSGPSLSTLRYRNGLVDGWIAASRAWEAVSITNPPRTTTPSCLGRALFERRTGTGYLWGAGDHV